VIVSYESQVVMEETLTEALEKLFGTPGGGGTATTTTAPPSATTTTVPGVGTTTTTTVPGEGETTSTTLPGADLPTDPASLAALAQQHFEAALEAQRRGDWAEYGRQIDELGRVLQALKGVTVPQG
jgi:hypothetical protein